MIRNLTFFGIISLTVTAGIARAQAASVLTSGEAVARHKSGCRAPLGQRAEAAPAIQVVQRRAFDFFWNESHPETGLTKDREKNQEGPDSGKSTVASIATTGYMLASVPIGVERRWITRKQGYERALKALRYIHDTLPNIHGFYYHFLDWRTGKRVWNSELSSIDTALLILGSLTAGEYWPKTELHRLAESLAARVDWRWMQTDGGVKPEELAPSMGWDPAKGFLPYRWTGYSEASFLYLLSMGTQAPKGLAPSAWNAWKFRSVSVEGFDVFGGPTPIFMAQMAAGYFDLKDLRDRQGRGWWRAWGNAHLADQAYCARKTDNKTYAAGFWAINASDQPGGYGADSPRDGHNTGTVSPTGMLAGVPFTPERSKKALDDLWTLRDKIWGRYGFCNAFNLDKSWYDTDVLGLDLGMMLVSTENARSGLIWRLMGQSPFARRGLAAAGFHKGMNRDRTSERP